MKSLKLFVVIGALLASWCIPALHAQDGKGKGGGPGDRLKMMSEALALTDAQKEKVKAIVADEAAAMKALRDDTSVAEDARRGKMREIRQAHAAKIRAVLTPEQQAKFDEMGAKMGGGKGGGKKGKKDE
ncbi:MAG TPA: Spy/CpxP family protein refolding chaperone [Opitutaceae bacterium]|nr:Spy/CpxP family protein refolding chaperone [Opitutaceae bacterium]